jgi:hypothetical protein
MPFLSVLTIGVLSFLTTFVTGLITFGDAILFFLLWRTVRYVAPSLIDVSAVTGGDAVREFHFVVILLSTRSLFVMSAQVYFVWHESQWAILRASTPGTVIATLIGCIVLDAYGEATWLHPVIGVVFTSAGGVALALRERQRAIARSAAPDPQTAAAAATADVAGAAGASIDSIPPPRDAGVAVPCAESPQPSQAASPVSTTVLIAQHSASTAPAVANATPTFEDAASAASPPAPPMPPASPSIPAIWSLGPQSPITAPRADSAPAAPSTSESPYGTQQYMHEVLQLMVVASFFAGIISGLVNVPGVVLVLVVAFKFNEQNAKPLSRGLLPQLFLLMAVTRAVYNLTHASSDMSGAVAEIASAVIGGIGGIAVGNHVGKLVNNEQFLVLVISMMIIAGLSLGNAPMLVVFAAVALLSVWIGMSFRGVA